MTTPPERDNTDEIVANVPLRALQPVGPNERNSDGNELWRLLNVLAGTLDDLDDDMADVADELRLDTAGADGLDRRGRAIGVQRRTNEDLDTYRRRLFAAYGAAASDGTLQSFSQVLLNVLDTDASAVDLKLNASTDPIVVIDVDDGVISSSPFTSSEVISLILESLPAADGVKIEFTGTFELADTINNSYDPGSAAGLGNGTLSGSII